MFKVNFDDLTIVQVPSVDKVFNRVFLRTFTTSPCIKSEQKGMNETDMVNLQIAPECWQTLYGQGKIGAKIRGEGFVKNGNVIYVTRLVFVD